MWQRVVNHVVGGADVDLIKWDDHYKKVKDIHAKIMEDPHAFNQQKPVPEALKTVIWGTDSTLQQRMRRSFEYFSIGLPTSSRLSLNFDSETYVSERISGLVTRFSEAARKDPLMRS
jgi:hypothetical protein